MSQGRKVEVLLPSPGGGGKKGCCCLGPQRLLEPSWGGTNLPLPQIPRPFPVSVLPGKVGPQEHGPPGSLRRQFRCDRRKASLGVNHQTQKEE